MKLDTRQPRIDPRRLDLRGMLGIARIQRHLAPGARRDIGQCRAPGAGTDHAD
ncbi:hypothetical protein ACVJF0_005821 [Bradyrhizobium elkanii]